ncbi:MAG: pilus assembly protein PilP [Bdellovibrionaceae bacterium]|nr:pilus assembly protein PilP [Pseudobdellovibrionaceae bacterium]
MNFIFILILNSLFIQTSYGQSPPVEPETPPTMEAHSGEPSTAEPFPTTMTEELNDANGIVLKKNNFIYDGAEGRDPFKVYRELQLFNPTDGSNPAVKVGPVIVEKSIRTAAVPGDIVILGILYKKNDPIALVKVRDVKGLNKLRLNSPVGRNEGKVIEIHKDRIVIEQVRDFDGQKFTEKVTLKVREKKN